MRRLSSLRSRTLLVICATAVVLLLFPARAEAHLNSTGLGPAYDGLLHFLLSPEDLLPVIALSLFAGRRGSAFGRWGLFLLPGAWLLGGSIGMGHGAGASPLVAILSFVLTGGLLAADAKLPFSFFPVITLALGMSHGYLNAQGLGSADSHGIAMLGIAIAVFVVVALCASFAVPLRSQWMRISLRVAGSWTVACGILLAGWAARK
jgi:urease accessory protein